MKRSINIGCIADDFTGAGDAASFLAEAGLDTVLCDGVPESAQALEGAEAAVIALKTRTQQATSAVKDSMRALRFFTRLDAKLIYIKYCSTFDSTPQGNIGPICDAAMMALAAPYTLLCPSLPANGRTVVNGELFVHGIPLAETHMRHHPLTPMWSSSIPELMARQSKYPVKILSADHVSSFPRTYATNPNASSEASGAFYLVPDYQTDEDGRRIAQAFGKLPLLTGGSGLLGKVGRLFSSTYASTPRTMPPLAGKTLILCGSCSRATQEQVKHFLDLGGNGIMLDPEGLASNQLSAEKVWQDIVLSGDDTAMVYSSGSIGLPLDEHHRHEHADALESAFANLALMAVAAGYAHIIVAGGETAGAVTKALQLNSFRIGPSIAPGVPVLLPTKRPGLRLVLKSGNFGQTDFFLRAIYMMGGQQA